MASANPDRPVTTGILGWLDTRFPSAYDFYRGHLAGYYAPKNFNFWYFFGSLAMLVLGLQIITGIFLVMHYKPDASLNASGVPIAFASVEYIMRDVPWGWLIRYMHSTGASAFFIIIYAHMFRGMLYGSYRNPRELVWIFGMILFQLLMAEGFMGYLLPWGQLSYWGAQVIVNMFTTIPWVGSDLALWLRGDFVVSDATLTRFFAFHVIALPLALVGLVVVHILALHDVGSNNPDGIEIKKHKDANGIPLDGIPFHPYYTVKDIVGMAVFLMVFASVIFFLPEGGGYFLENNNFVPADQFKGPPHIAPVWYFTPFYSILRANTVNFFWIDAKLWGVINMGLSVMIFALLPWLDRSPVKSIRYKGPIFKSALAIFTVSFLVLGVLGTQPPERWSWGPLTAQICTVLYFLFFLLMPIYSKIDKCKPEPDRVTSK
ncbi:MAG: cytochrome bc complex cytochrome b subunit [Georgfuchsia sp.]